MASEAPTASIAAAHARAAPQPAAAQPPAAPQPAAARDPETLRLSLCAAICALGLLALVGWLFGIEPLKSVLPGFSTMKFNAAACFLLTGVALALAGRRRWAPAATLAAAAVALTGGLTLAQYPLGLDLGIDRLAVADRGTLRGSGFPGRMSPLAAAAFAALGAAALLLIHGRARRAHVAAHLCAAFAGLMGFVAVAGYTFGAEAYGAAGFYTAMAVHTAAGLLAAAAAGLMTRAREGWLEPFADSPNARSVLARTLPLTLAVPTALGLLILLGAGAGLYNAPFGFALFVPLTIAAMVGVALWVAGRVRHADLALRETGAALDAVAARYRTLFEEANDYILTCDLDQRVIGCNPALARALGYREDELVGRPIHDFLDPDQAEQSREMLRRKLDRGGTTRHTIRVNARSGQKMVWEVNSQLTHAPDGAPTGLHAICRDVTEQRQAEEHLRLLVAELNHRVKNTLAIVQGLSQQSFGLRGAAAGQREAFEGRLQALSAAHDLLTRENWAGAELGDVVRGVLALFEAGGGRICVDGPDLRLPPKTAVALAMALHELATNAVKYGALSVPEGRVSIGWSIDAPAGSFRLAWREQGGPPVRPPARRGFGTRMIERALAAELEGSATLDFRPEGLVCAIEAPLARVAGEVAPGGRAGETPRAAPAAPAGGR